MLECKDMMVCTDLAHHDVTCLQAVHKQMCYIVVVTIL